ncbi:unnamed protein product [marine sediment metagenome]|uniref:Uncharacterized protein n=1 Tax=marine sediment metagenome TaxID=412755 RepID=X0Z4A0_9ZZZZ
MPFVARQLSAMSMTGSVNKSLRVVKFLDGVIRPLDGALRITVGIWVERPSNLANLINIINFKIYERWK